MRDEAASRLWRTTRAELAHELEPGPVAFLQSYLNFNDNQEQRSKT